jgi:hypothetical protein
MNHPTDEQWMSYLYDEVGADERSRLLAHLRDCVVCAEQLDRWQAATRELDAWQLRARRAKSASKRAREIFLRRALPWAAAAMILLGAGFLLGRMTSASIEPNRLLAIIEPELRQQLRQEFELKRIEDNRAIYAALEKLDSQRIADYVSLKKELDTVAVLTDAGLRNTVQQLARLADYAQSTAPLGASSGTTP